MTDIQFGSVLPSPSHELLEHTQAYYKITFPKTYVDFISENNGGVPDHNEFLFEGNYYLVERFTSLLNNDLRDTLADDNWCEMRSIITQLDERLVDDEDLIGMNIIPIAILFAGDYVCLDYRKDANNPSVCLWFHEKSREFAPGTEKIANNFEEFIHMLE